MSLTNKLYKLSRLSADVSALSSGKPSKILRRGKNKVVGRALGKAGIWRRLWK